MLKLDTPINLDVGQFFRWWWGTLWALVPDWFKSLLGQKRDSLLLEIEADQLLVTLLSGHERRSLGRFSLDEQGKATFDLLLQDEPDLQDAELILMLSSSQTLSKTLSLPLMAEQNLREVVGFELDRQTPFKMEQVYYDLRVLERTTQSKKIKIEFVLVPRAKLDAVFEELRVWGIRAAAVDVFDHDGRRLRKRFNLLPIELRPKGSRLPKILNTLFAFGLLFALLIAFVLPVWMERSWVIELQQKVDAAAKIARKVQDLKEVAENSLRETRFLLEKKRQQPVLVHVLNELSGRIPSDTWLTDLKYKDRRLQIQGQSPAASALIEIIEESAFFKNTSFVSPVTQDRKTNLERFQISTDVLNGGELVSEP